MITPGMSLKKALLFSLIIHIILVITTLPRFHRKPVHYWMATPVELVSLPAIKPAVTQPVTTVVPVQEKKKIKEEKKVKEKKVVINKNIMTINPKKKKAEEKPQLQQKEIPQPLPVAAPAAVPAAVAPQTQTMTVIPDINDFPYAYYLKIIKNNVGSNWEVAQLGAGSHTVTVFFRIDRSGKVQDVSVEKSSGRSYYDQLALKAVLRSNPFPALPEGYKESFLNIHYNFKYNQEG